MRSFTSYLHRSMRPEWERYYLDYLSLKNVLEKFADRRGNLSADSSIENIEHFYPEAEQTSEFKRPKYSPHHFKLMVTSSEEREQANSKNETVKDYVAKLERDEFCYLLDKETNKISKLYRQQLTELKSDIDLLKSELNQSTAGGTAIDETGGLFQTFLEKFKKIGDEILELHAFIGANITALRQILIRYDSLIRTLDGPPLGQWYIITRREVFVDSDFEAIFVRHGLFLLTDTFSYALAHLKAMTNHIQQDTANEINQAVESYLNELNLEISKMESVILRAEQSVDKAFRSRLALTDSIVYSLRYFFLAGTAMNELLMQPSFIRTRGLKLKDEIRFFAKWRTERVKPTLDNSTGNIRDLLNASLWLNFASQFLYMMNHYIIEPSSTQYVHELGGRDALSGLLIGMTPWAGLISAFVYSYWSNRSFREPLICSGIFLTLGSFFYANALKFDSLTMAMVGRFMTGLGAPCGLNVRFIADTVKKANRTAISAILVTVSAMGMSLGPFCAVLLDFVDIDINIPLHGEMILNGMTGPGYMMFLLWSTYLWFLLAYFKDNERIGLMEIEKNTNMSHYAAPSLETSTSLDSHDTGDDAYFSCDEDDNLEHEEDLKTSIGKLRYINEATVICMLLKFIGKFVLEIMGCSVSLITRHRYDWSVKSIGMLSFVNGLLVIPISTSIGYLSQHYTDITLLYWLLGVAMLGLLFLFDVTDFGANPYQEMYYEAGYNSDSIFAVHSWKYVVGIVLEFCGFQASQSVVLSMLSKVVPLSLARGTFNSGFMATTLSTLARANGDLLITVMGLISIRELLNLLVVPCLLMTGFCIMIAYFHKDKLAV